MKKILPDQIVVFWRKIVVADYSECPIQEVVADAKHGWCYTERCQKVRVLEAMLLMLR